jgi:phosphoribosylformylglycinamidine synthase
MVKAKVIVLSGYGLNCEEETLHAFKLAGAEGDIVHANDLIDSLYQLDDYQIMAVPGGFSYGDDTGSGNAYASKLKNHLFHEVRRFVEKDHLVIGICNGFQILANLGLFGNVALLHNDSARYTVRWVDLRIENNSPWFAGIKTISLPIAHGEGKFFAYDDVLKRLNKEELVAARYVKGEICRHQMLPPNPNGALENIAAITDVSGRILGMMPHPERAVSFTQLPHWTYLKEKCLREKRKPPNKGPGLQIFQNAVNYFK